MDEETQMAAVTEFWGFTRRQGESTNSLWARYEIVRNRALTDGNFQMGVVGCVLQLLRASVAILAQGSNPGALIRNGSPAVWGLAPGGL